MGVRKLDSCGSEKAARSF